MMTLWATLFHGNEELKVEANSEHARFFGELGKK